MTCNASVHERVARHALRKNSFIDREGGYIGSLRDPNRPTLPETNMETQKGPYKDYSPFKRGLYGFPCSFGGVYPIHGSLGHNLF